MRKGGIIMEKLSYERPEIEVVSFDDEDVITASGEIETPEVGAVQQLF